MAIAGKVLTLEEFLRLPEEKPALEYEDGRITQKVSPRLPHAALHFEIAALFNQQLRPDRIAWAFTELRTTFTGRSRVPDISVYRWDRIPRDAAGALPFDNVMIPPDVAVEIRSPEQTIASQLRRCRDYVEQGVVVAIMVAPEAKRLWVFRIQQPERELAADDAIDFEDIFPGFKLTPAEIFAVLQVDYTGF
jgi:Uma2 family endonuclease